MGLSGDGGGWVGLHGVGLLFRCARAGPLAVCFRILALNKLICPHNHTHTLSLPPKGTITFDEFQSIVFDGMLLDGTLAEYERAFAAVDDSGNGSIGKAD